MAALIVPDLRNPKIVCQEPCKHRDCAGLREEWHNAICRFCNKPLKPEQRFYYDNGGHVHALCLEEQIEERRISDAQT